MQKFRRYNLIFGWVSFIVALVVYLLTIEPTVSLWDCGEFIASSYKLQVGHPPGAPLYLLMGRVFSLLASDTANVAKMYNAFSATVSAFTILFLFWTITHLLKKVFIKSEEDYTLNNYILILGSSFVGALAYTFPIPSGSLLWKERFTHSPRCLPQLYSGPYLSGRILQMKKMPTAG